MSQASVEIVQGHLDAFRANDAAGAVSFLDINVVADMSRMGGVERPVSRGREELIEGMRSYIGAFEDYEYEVEHVTDLGSGAVVAAVTETGRGKNSGVPVSRSIALLYTVIAGVIVRITVFPAELEALEAVGKTQ